MTKVFQFQDFQFNYSNKKYILGIINLSPDSFANTEKSIDLNKAINLATQMIKDGVDIIDVGGESTRPYAKTIDVNLEIGRIFPFIQALRKISKIPISIDTRKSQVAKIALKIGANIVNDISGLKYDKKIAKIIFEYKAGCILMHMRGNPNNMQNFTNYNNLIKEITKELQESIDIANNNNISHNQIILDVGIGFSKNTLQNLQLINNLDKFKTFNLPILLGTSKKSFIGEILNKKETKNRLWGTAASLSVGLIRGAQFFRVHDVREMSDVIRMTKAIIKS